jgi:hypothetical protein
MKPVGLKPPSRHAPRRLGTTADLRRLQRLMINAMVRPLTEDDRLQERWIDGRATRDVAAEFIKPNDRLTSFERLEIYSRMYWFRLIGCASDDHPGLQALLGERKFERLVRAYLARYPSRSFTLRNLCSRLPGFIGERPELTAPRTAAALAVARFEWAQTVAFDGEARPPLAPGDIASARPERLRVGLQPYLSVLAFDYPVDTYVIAVKRRNALRAEASNAVDRVGRSRRRRTALPRLLRGRIHLAVHRHSGRLYYKRLERPEFLILGALAAGRPVARAIEAGGRRVRPEKLREWFATWTKLGWLCRR